MQVYYFTVNKLTSNHVSIHVLFKAFGDNIPNYRQCVFGNHYPKFLFCVDARKDISEICDKYNYRCGTRFRGEVANECYNESYIATSNPSENEYEEWPVFSLEKVL